MASGYLIEALTPSNFAELTPLVKDAFGDELHVAYFDWKYLANPAGPAIGNIARNETTGEIAAFYGMIPERYYFQGRQRLIYQSCDTMTHSTHRRRGLFKRLALATYADAIRFDDQFMAFGFGGPTSTPGFLIMNWRIGFVAHYLFRPFPLTVSLRGRAGPVRHFEELTPQLVRMIEGSDTSRKDSLVKDEDFIRWRLANPRRNYEYLADEASYAIYYQSGRFLFLFDFWEREPGIGRHVVRALCRTSLKRRLKGILTFCQPDTDFDRRLRRHGFWRNPFPRGPAAGGIPFITFNDSTSEAKAFAWSISPFDHDSY